MCSSHALTTALAATTAALLSSSCATLVKGSAQSVTIDTKPPAAVCTLSRGAERIAVVNPTPGTVSIEKSKDPIAVVCKKDGFEDSAGTIESQFQAMTLGNVLFGGLVGVVVDAASGAMHEYAPTVTLTLIPAEFASEQERDEFFARLREEFIVEAAAAKDRISKMCNPETCDSQIKAAEAATVSKLAEIEKRRLLAKVKR